MSENTASQNHKSIVLRLLVVAVCLYLLVTLGGLYSELGEKRAELEEIKALTNEKQLSINEINDLLQNGTEREKLERELRNNGYSYPGEITYKGIN
ncbi:MAG: hypothetical protein J6V50_00645 [Clostridia bacterium]|nr:hypothetical protein [Clostridia bacterium]